MIITQHWYCFACFDRVLIIDEDTQSTLFMDIKEDADYGYKKTARFWNLYVKEEYRKQGIATKLIKDAEQAAKKKGCVATFLKWKFMSAGFIKDWYRRLGYTEKEVIIEKKAREGYIIYEKTL